MSVDVAPPPLFFLRSVAPPYGGGRSGGFPPSLLPFFPQVDVRRKPRGAAEDPPGLRRSPSLPLPPVIPDAELFLRFLKIHFLAKLP